MALGLPVVSTNVGGIPYLLEHNVNALLVEDYYVDGITNQIKHLFKEPNQALNLSKKRKNRMKALIGKLSKSNGLNCLFKA
jgi:glycosyltransferase involved in cell wall biosynthesis